MSADPRCTFHKVHPDTDGLMRCSADAGHGDGHYFKNDRDKILFSWTGNGPVRRETRP